jgi:hypothetical protein
VPCGHVQCHTLLRRGPQQEHRAGYTLAELVHLSRSAVPAQKALALDVLGRVIDQVNAGACASGPPRGGWVCGSAGLLVKGCA